MCVNACLRGCQVPQVTVLLVGVCLLSFNFIGAAVPAPRNARALTAHLSICAHMATSDSCGAQARDARVLFWVGV